MSLALRYIDAGEVAQLTEKLASICRQLGLTGDDLDRTIDAGLMPMLVQIEAHRQASADRKAKIKLQGFPPFSLLAGSAVPFACAPKMRQASPTPRACFIRMPRGVCLTNAPGHFLFLEPHALTVAAAGRGYRSWRRSGSASLVIRRASRMGASARASMRA
jgi:hypothetical protein